MLLSCVSRRLQLPALLACLLPGCAGDSAEPDALAPRRTLEPWVAGLPFGECPLEASGIGLRAACPRLTDEEKTAIGRAGRRQRGAATSTTKTGRADLLARLLGADSPEAFAACLGGLERRAREVAGEGAPEAEALTDLAAAYLLRADVLGDANDYLFAADAARAALDLQPAYAPALFDLALAYERLYLRRAAREAWKRLLQAVSSGGWAGEAKAHLAKLEGERRPAGEMAAAQDLQAQREKALDELFPAWAEAVAAGRTSLAGEIEERIATVAALSAAAGDAFLGDALHALRAGDRVSLAAAHRDLAVRRAGRREGKRRACAAGLAELAASFARQASPLRYEALRLEASCAYERLDYPTAEAVGAAWKDGARRAGYPVSEGLASWFLGSTASAVGEYAVATDLYLQAKALLLATGEKRREAELRGLLSNVQARSGDPAGAWRLLHRTLGDILAAGDARRLSISLQEAGLQLGLAGKSELGLLYSEENLQADLGDPEVAARFDARWLHCWLLQKSERRNEAMEELQALHAMIGEAPDPDSRRRFELLAMTAESEIFLDADPPRSAAAAERAIAAYRAASFDTAPLDLHLNLAKARSRLDEVGKALAALEEGLTYFSSQAARDPEISAKVRLFDRAEKILEEKMQLELRLGNDVAAFETLEKGRAHLLLDELGAHASTLEEIQAALAPREVLVEYLFVNGRAMAFRVDRRSFGIVELQVDHSGLEALLAAWNAAEATAEKRVAADLHHLLVRPLELAPDERLLISFPDEMAALPWAALFDSAAGRRLIEQRQLLVVPSASAMLAIEKRGKTLPSLAEAPLLAAGDPAFDTRMAPQLAKHLPGALAEARGAAASFRSSRLLERESATGTAFLAAMENHPLVLYSGHAVADSAEPLATKLYFAPDAAFPTGELAARDFYRRKLPAGALVILSGCETGGGFGSKVEGRIDLAHPFLASGAAAVILTRRSVDDRSAQKFLELFLEKLRASGDPWEAFRQAQIHSIHAGRSSRLESPIWAVYQLVGSRWSEQEEAQ